MKRSCFALALAAALLFVCAPVKPAGLPGSAPREKPANLTGFFDCVREHRGVLISAHRGGPAPGYAENALPTFRHTAANGLSLLEMDVRTSSDGVLFLLHDDTLGRLTRRHGKAEALPWKTLQHIELKDENGRFAGAHIPRFSAVLDWARTAPVVLQLDIKGHTRIRPMMRAVKSAGMGQRVMIITYSPQQAIRTAKLAPGTLLSVSVDTMSDLAAMLKGGIKPAQMVAWTGIGPENPALYAKLARQGIESIYGALGGLDARARRRGGALYRQLESEGVQIIATNRPKAVRRSIHGDERAQENCPLPPVSN